MCSISFHSLWTNIFMFKFYHRSCWIFSFCGFITATSRFYSRVFIPCFLLCPFYLTCDNINGVHRPQHLLRYFLRLTTLRDIDANNVAQPWLQLPYISALMPQIIFQRVTSYVKTSLSTLYVGYYVRQIFKIYHIYIFTRSNFTFIDNSYTLH